ncbi:MAG: S4 domain-containing protein [Pseudomonadota bacterium]|nr:S4 domain-containing protein [Pseudomonadota bacterium]
MPRSASSDLFVVRLDQWLWAARFYKTRSLAREAIESGKVEVGAERVKPARPVRLDDALRITRGEETFEVVVSGLSDKRGPASEAQTLYVESHESLAERQRLREERISQRTGYRAPDGKPDKRARRLIRALGDIDAL